MTRLGWTLLILVLLAIGGFVLMLRQGGVTQAPRTATPSRRDASRD